MAGQQTDFFPIASVEIGSYLRTQGYQSFSQFQIDHPLPSLPIPYHGVTNRSSS
jgi:hypothetical protein